MSNPSVSCTSKSRSEDHGEAGFSLVELSVALVIIGLLMGLALPMLQAHTQRAMIKVTRDHQRLIHGALKVYQQTQRNHTLPCPADPKALGKKRGIANCAMRNHEGIVPHRTLGLPERMAQDGYQHYFTYAVEHNVTRPMDDFATIKGGHIQVFNSEGLPVLDSKVEGNFVTFVLVSHGPSGEGAFTPSGERLPIINEVSPAKRRNVNGHPEYQEGGGDQVYWVSQLVFRSAVDPQ